jgi:diphthamide biosynthesis enzyme Dph1/Dph2-like protein
MEHMLIDAKFEGKSILLNHDVITHIKKSKYSIIALYAAVQFTHLLEPVIKQLEDLQVRVVSSKPLRTNEEYQLLGCITYKEALRLNEEPDAFLYVGDGVFHPRALVLAQREDANFKEIIRFDPIADKMTLMNKEDCELIIKKYNSGLAKFLMSNNIGVLITIKPGQQQLKVSKKLREAFPGKNIYYFAQDTLDSSHLEDFNFIDSWVNSACPRIGFDDAVNLSQSMINITDALRLAVKKS